MKYLAPARRIACVVIVILGAFGAHRISADEARVTAVTAVKENAALAYQSFSNAIELPAIASSGFSAPELSTGSSPAFAASEKGPMAEAGTSTADTQSALAADQPVIVALAEPPSPAATGEPRVPIGVPPASAQWPAPARFFTINQVLAKRQQTKSKSPEIQLAAIDPKIMSDASATPAAPTRSDEPFGLFTFRAPEGLLWTKWRGVEANIQAEAPALARCRAEPDHCTPAEARFIAIINRAERRQGRDRLEVINESVNAAIHYMTDMAQWGVADLWSAPINVNGKGSFDTGFGDCEDYAIAKYVALREAGMPAENLRLLLVRDNSIRLDHAVLAAHQDDHWLVLDNRWSQLTEDTGLRQFLPLFALGEEGVKLFARPYAARNPTGSTNSFGNRADQDQSIAVGANFSEAATGVSSAVGGALLLQ